MRLTVTGDHSRDVYFVADGKLTKIGLTGAGMAWQRLTELQVGNPRELFVIAVIPGSRELEKQLHERYAAQRVRGEWFKRVPIRHLTEEFGGRYYG